MCLESLGGQTAAGGGKINEPPKMAQLDCGALPTRRVLVLGHGPGFAPEASLLQVGEAP